MKKAPNEYTLADIVRHAKIGTTVRIGKQWVPARPEGYFGLWHRLRLAWKVFRGKADIVTWPKGQ